MKNIIRISCVGIIALLIGCSTNSSKEPQFRVANEHSGKANVQIKTSGGNTININGIDSAFISAYQGTAQGHIDVTANAQGDTTTARASFNAMNDYTYTIMILNTNPTSLNVISP
ncbi:MAG: hypothetical protein ABSF80_08600 [Chitinispirillaceae bacterium]|jgi:hypothetical protein